MIGLAIGKQSSVATPYLQLFSRQGGFLTDIFSGSFIIERITNPAATTATGVVTTTAIHTTNDKLGTGRYVLKTEATTGWTAGYHRAVVTYKLVSGGTDIVQIIPFEVLTALDWPRGGAEYVGYISSWEAYKAGFAVYGTDALRVVHELICRISRQIEKWTGHQFHPAYKSLYLNGYGTNEIDTIEPVIAVDRLEWTWRDDTGEQTYKYETYQYRPFNHHLDGEVGKDSRLFSVIEFVIDQLGDPYYREGRAPWRGTDRELKLTGVFGYTDPEMDIGTSGVLLGETPRPLAEVVGVLLSRAIEDRLLTNPAGMFPSRVKALRTRDQSIQFFGSTESSSLRGVTAFTGDPALDMVIAQYLRATSLVCA